MESDIYEQQQKPLIFTERCHLGFITTTTTTTTTTIIIIIIIKLLCYRGILSSIVVDDPESSRVPLGPLCDVVDLSIYHQPLVIPAAVALHLLPGVNATSSPAARLPWLRELASTSHPSVLSLAWIHRSCCTLNDPDSHKVKHLDVKMIRLTPCWQSAGTQCAEGENEDFNLLHSFTLTTQLIETQEKWDKEQRNIFTNNSWWNPTTRRLLWWGGADFFLFLFFFFFFYNIWRDHHSSVSTCMDV